MGSAFLQAKGRGTIVEVRELGKKANKDDIWRRVVKIAVEGVTAEFCVSESLFSQMKNVKGLVIDFQCEGRSGMGGQLDWHLVQYEAFDELAWMKSEIEKREKAKRAA